MTRPRRFIKEKLAVSIALSCLLSMALVFHARTASAPSAPNLPRHKIQVSDPALAARLAALGARRIADYGGFQIYDADATALAATAGHAQTRDNYNFVMLNAARLDTSQPEIQGLRKNAGAFAGKHLHLIQFAGPPQPGWRDDVVKTGASIVSYVPQNAYLVYGDSAAIGRLQSMAAQALHVQWDAAYSAEYKIHPAAKAVDAKGNAKAVGTELFAIQMVADAGPNAETLQLLDGLKLEPLHPNHFALSYLNVVGRFRPADLPRIAGRPDVVSILPYGTPKKQDERQDQIVAGKLTGNLPGGPGYLAWLESKGFTQAQFDASGFIVNVSDSGIDDGTTSPNHFGLYNLGVIGTGNSRVAYNRLEGTANPDSTLKGCDGHGNINAHIIGGYDDGAIFPFEDAEGYHYGLGVSPFVRLGSSVVFDPGNFTNPNFSDLESAAYESGARIDNNSWGGNDGIYDSEAQEYDALVRDADASTPGNQEMVIVFAAGNDGNSGITTPGTAKNVITVGAAESVQALGGTDNCGWPDSSADDANAVASFSGIGPCDDGRHKPDLVAPGTHISGGVIQAANPAADGSADLCFVDFNKDFPGEEIGVCGGVGTDLFFPAGQQFYTTSTGTSHSTPCVTGGCALLRQYFINEGLSAPSPAMTKAYLMNSARYMTGSGANDTLWSDSQGMGELDLGLALDGAARILQDEQAANIFTATGQTRVFRGSISATNLPFRVTLAWTDAPGSTVASSAANNDLDLTVTVGGVTYLGNVFSGEYSVAGGSPDTVDNVESVFLPAGVSGPFTITVTAANINSVGIPNNANALEQDFALVAYNASPVGIAGATVMAESCTPTNGAIDPGETVTVNFALQNDGLANLGNLVVMLQPTGGVELPDGAKMVAALVAGGPAATVPFTFTAEGSCGGTITASLALQAGATNLGTISVDFTLGQFVTTPIFTQNFNSNAAPEMPSGWTTDATGGGSAWITEDTNGTVDSPPNAAFCPDSPSIGVGELISPEIPINSATAKLQFRQSYELEAYPQGDIAYDGGVLEIKIGNGAFTDILAAGGAFLQNGYNRTIDADEGPNNADPLAGRAAWSGISGPYATNTYITTIVQLPASAEGQNIQLKWRLGTDADNFYPPFAGWWVDTILISDGFYSCCAPTAVTQPEIISPSDGFQTAASTAQVAGDAIPGLLLTMYDNGVSNTSFVVASNGFFTAQIPLLYGGNALIAEQTESDTNLASSIVNVVLTNTLVPVITVQPQNQTNFLRGNVIFTSAAAGAPPLKYYWEKNGVKIPGAITTNLVLDNVTSATVASYQMVATNKYGSATSSNATFTLVPNPFIGLTGIYSGLFLDNPALYQNSGFISLHLTSLGGYTASILNAGGRYSFSGAFPYTGHTAQTVTGVGLPPLTLNLTLDLVNGTEQILGTVSNANWLASLQADRAIYTTVSPAPQAGNYTLVFASASNGIASPGGDGYAKVTVGRTGLISMVDVLLSDDTAVAYPPVSISKFGQWPIYIPLYGKVGSLSGFVNFTNLAGAGFQGNAAWFRTNSSGKLYPRGFTNYLSIIGSTFAPGTAKIPALGATNLQITLGGADLPEALSNDLTLTLAGKFVTNGAGISKLTLNVVPSTGLISGSFSDPMTRLATPIKGILLQQQTNAGGFFLGTNMTGSFLLSLPPP